jgi:MFS family permease
MTMVADVALVELFDAGSVGYGILIACWGGGSILGSLLGRRLTAATESRWLVAGVGTVAAMSIATGVSPWFTLVLGAILVMGIADGLTLVAEQGIMQRRTPDAVRSRVSGAFDSVVHIGMAVSYVVAGPMVAWLGARRVYVVGGVAAFAAVFITLPIRRAGQTATPQGEPRREVDVDAGSLLVP